VADLALCSQTSLALVNSPFFLCATLVVNSCWAEEQQTTVWGRCTTSSDPAILGYDEAPLRKYPTSIHAAQTHHQRQLTISNVI